jgi:hypothetical protein
MKCCSLVSASVENGWTYLANSFFLNVRNSPNEVFMKKKNLEKLLGKLENSRKTESAFFNGNGWTDLANSFFFYVRNSPNEVLMEKKMKKFPGKLENLRKTESGFFLWDFCDGYT